MRQQDLNTLKDAGLERKLQERASVIHRDVTAARGHGAALFYLHNVTKTNKIWVRALQLLIAYLYMFVPLKIFTVRPKHLSTLQGSDCVGC